MVEPEQAEITEENQFEGDQHPDVDSQNEADGIERDSEQPDGNGYESIPEDSDETDEVFVLNQKLAEVSDKYVRAVAEHENHRKRMAGELDRTRKYAIDQFAREMLEVLESLEIACEIRVGENAEETVESMREGIELTLKLLHGALAKFSIEEINPLAGEVFDANFHQAMTMQPSEEYPANHIMETFRKGYRIHDRLLRPAMVVVTSQGSGKASSNEPADES